jgi:hypothetical protein
VICILLSGSASAQAPAAPSTPVPQQIGGILGSSLVWIVVLLILSAAGLIAWLRFSHRLRQRLDHQPRRTDSPDLWSQHRLPPDWDDQEPAPDQFPDEDRDFLDDSETDE